MVCKDLEEAPLRFDRVILSLRPVAFDDNCFFRDADYCNRPINNNCRLLASNFYRCGKLSFDKDNTSDSWVHASEPDSAILIFIVAGLCFE